MRGSVENVRRSLARLRDALKGRSPRDIDNALPALSQAMVAVQEIERKLHAGEKPGRHLRAALFTLTREIDLTQQLADQGLALYRSRARELAALAGGYGATGLPSPVATGSTIRIEG